MFISWEEVKVGARLLVSFYHLIKGECSTYATIEKWASKTPDNTAIFFEDRKLTYKELNVLANKVANHFTALGGKKGDVAAVYMENCPEYLALIIGLNKIGMVASLINTNLRQKTLVHAFTICGPKWIVSGRSLIEHVDAVMSDVPLAKSDVWIWDGEAEGDYAARDLGKAVSCAAASEPKNKVKPKFDDHIMNIYTSGTTGLPKAARVSNRRVFFSGYALGYALSKFSNDDVIYVPLPLYHSIAMFVGWGGSMATGAAIGLRRWFSASDYWKEAIRFGATGATFIGEMPRYLMAQPESPEEKKHKIKRIITVGLRSNIWTAFQKRFEIEKIFEFYGATETSVGVMNVEGRPGFLGKLLPLQAYVVKWDPENEALMRNEKGRCDKVEQGEEGMLIGRINSIFNLLGFDGYIDDEETRKKLVKGVFNSWDEFFVTGDVVKLHEDNWISFVDRSGDTFRWKSENVATKEVEYILDSCPGVSDVNVYGVQIPGQEGAAGMAAVVLDCEWDRDAVSEYVDECLPHYARPLFIRLCKELPTTVTMKHIKYGLRKDGFDPGKIKDPVYFWDRHAKKYVPLEEDLYADIINGNVRL